MRKILLSVALAGAALSVAPMAAATTAVAMTSPASYSFEQCLSGCTGTVSSLASLKMTAIDNGVQFDLVSSSPLDSFISGLYFNGVSGAVDWDFSLQSYKSYSYSTIAKLNVLTSANGYNWDFIFPTASKADRFFGGDSASWTITGTGVDLLDFTSSEKMMIHVQNLANRESVKLAAVAAVPEPESFAMLIAGLGLMGTIVRRRSKSGSV